MAYDFTRQRFEQEEIDVNYFAIERILANGIKKAFSRFKYAKLCKGMGICAFLAEKNWWNVSECKLLKLRMIIEFLFDLPM